MTLIALWLFDDLLHEVLFNVVVPFSDYIGSGPEVDAMTLLYYIAPVNLAIFIVPVSQAHTQRSSLNQRIAAVWR